jgi:hypothetical protein
MSHIIVPFKNLNALLLYVAITTIGFLLFLTGGTLLSRLLMRSLNNDIFNKLNESFPQEERLLENEYSINLPATSKIAALSFGEFVG